MPYLATYTPDAPDAPDAPDRATLDALPGPVLLEFGAGWCPHCQTAQPAIEQLLQQAPQWQHVKVEDGAGRRLGRSFRVKLWPTLIVLQGGVELGRVVRPTSAAELAPLLALLPAAG